MTITILWTEGCELVAGEVYSHTGMTRVEHDERPSQTYKDIYSLLSPQREPTRWKSVLEVEDSRERRATSETRNSFYQYIIQRAAESSRTAP